MPGKLECASKNTVAISGLHAALGWLPSARTLKREKELTAYLMERLNEVECIRIYRAPDESCQAGIVSLNVPGFACGETAAILDAKYDIAVRAGHHCAALIHRHLCNDDFKGTIRVSLGYFTQPEEIDRLTEALRTISREDLKDIDLDALRGLC